MNYKKVQPTLQLTVKVPKEKPIDIPLLNVSSNKFKYNINTKEPLKIEYKTVNVNGIEYSLGKTKKKKNQVVRLFYQKKIS